MKLKYKTFSSGWGNPDWRQLLCDFINNKKHKVISITENAHVGTLTATVYYANVAGDEK